MAALAAAGPASPRALPLTLYTAGTPNGELGWKASICLEELGLQYSVHHVDLKKGEQKEEAFLKINPNGRIPAIVDHRSDDLPVFESGAVLLHLAEADPQRRLLPAEGRGRAEVLSWLFWQVGGLGPMAGQADWFLLMAPERSDLGIRRYITEVERLLGVMERQLEGREWLAAGQFSIADIACFPWVLLHDVWGISLSASFPNLRGWVDRIKSRPAVQRGLNVPEKNMIGAKTEMWQGWLGKARQGLEGIKAVPEPEE